MPSTGERDKAPVFVVGCPRSGTTFLYHALLSSGNFAIYRAESQVFNILEPLFGSLRFEHHRRALLAAWYKCPLFSKSGLREGELDQQVISLCRNAGDFLRMVMEAIARKQGVERWAECTPEHLLYLKRIKATLPDAIVIHVVRDGRDVCLSLAKQHWIKPFRWDGAMEKFVAALYWEWIVNRGRADGASLGDSYIEVRYEDLALNPSQTLAGLSQFVGQPLIYDEIRNVGIGCISEPNTSFAGRFQPVGRWKHLMTPSEKKIVEILIGNTLRQLGYETAGDVKTAHGLISLGLKRFTYQKSYDTKLILKSRTPLGQLLTSHDLSWL